MPIDFLAAAAIGGTIVINAVGWAYTLIKSSNQSGYKEGKTNQFIKSSREIINSLPCITDPTFVGSLKEHIKGIDEKLDMNEKAHKDIMIQLFSISKAVNNKR